MFCKPLYSFCTSTEKLASHTDHALDQGPSHSTQGLLCSVWSSTRGKLPLHKHQLYLTPSSSSSLTDLTEGSSPSELDGEDQFQWVPAPYYTSLSHYLHLPGQSNSTPRSHQTYGCPEHLAAHTKAMQAISPVSQAHRELLWHPRFSYTL